MRISLDQLSEIAKRFLRTLDREGIQDMPDLEHEIGVKHIVSDDEREFVMIGVTPSNHHTGAYSISYVMDGTGGTPIEAKINPTLGYTKIFVKAVSEVPGYFPFSMDAFGNTHQMKDFHTANMDVVRRELESL